MVKNNREKKSTECAVNTPTWNAIVHAVVCAYVLRGTLFDSNRVREYSVATTSGSQCNTVGHATRVLASEQAVAVQSSRHYSSATSGT